MSRHINSDKIFHRRDLIHQTPLDFLQISLTLTKSEGDTISGAEDYGLKCAQKRQSHDDPASSELGMNQFKSLQYPRFASARFIN
jgi:hypothetical protein